MEMPTRDPLEQGRTEFKWLALATSCMALILIVWETVTGLHLTMMLAQIAFSGFSIWITWRTWKGRANRWLLYLGWSLMGLFCFYQAGSRFDEMLLIPYLFTGLALGYLAAGVYTGYSTEVSLFLEQVRQAWLREKAAKENT